jgi:tRNA-(ms[2]io[6]A)-hydroxylase
MTAGHALEDVLAFLHGRTPIAWFEQANSHLPELLIDHANCEKKAAGTALSLLYRYVDKPELLRTLSKLAREELKHFEQVQSRLVALEIDYRHLSPGRYAAGLRRVVRTHEPGRLVDLLLVGAVVEARSCERFAGLVGVLPHKLGAFYERLLASEARHFHQYLELANRYADAPFDNQLNRMLEVDRELITSPDTVFRFHSGPLADQPGVREKQASSGSSPGA